MSVVASISISSISHSGLLCEICGHALFTSSMGRAFLLCVCPAFQ